MNNKINRAIIKRYYKYIKPLSGLHSEQKSDIPVEIVIPSIRKDLDTLPYCIDHLRKHLLHPIKTIYILSPDDPLMVQCCNEKSCVFIDEKKVEVVKKDSINLIVDGHDWSGWIYQQLLKLNIDSFCQSDNILILDSDTLLVKDQSFISNDRFIFNVSDEYNLPYSKPLKELLHINDRFLLSFVAHMMIFNMDILKEMKKDIEFLSGKVWFNAIIDSLDTTKPAAFSEYELYANYMKQKYPDKMYLEYWFNESRYRNELNAGQLISKNKRTKSISYHSYKEN